jgi:hypothetical protein
MADQFLLSLGTFPSSYHSLLIEAWKTVEFIKGFKSVLPLTREPDSGGHVNRSKKFDCYEIEERDIVYQIMQRNGRAKNIAAQTGE